NTVGESEVGIAVDRLSRMSDGILIARGEKASQGEREDGMVEERLQRAQADRLFGLRDGLVIGAAKTASQGLEPEDEGGITAEHAGAIDRSERKVVIARQGSAHRCRQGKRQRHVGAAV